MYFNLFKQQTPQPARELTRRTILHSLLLFFFTCLLSSCGFHLQGQTQLAPPMRTMYLQTHDPYSSLSRALKQSLKLSNVQLVSSPAQADIILTILSDTTGQQLVSVSGTQQTRQYSLTVTVNFTLSKPNGQTVLGTQTLTESRAIFTQSNQILGSSNEVNMLYQQMRRAIAYALMNRLGSIEVTQIVMDAYSPKKNIEKT